MKTEPIGKSRVDRSTTDTTTHDSEGNVSWQVSGYGTITGISSQIHPCLPNDVYVLLHGMWGTADLWRPWINKLSLKNIIYAINLPGRCGSAEGCDLGALSIDDYANVVANILVQINLHTYKRIHLVGHSMSGLVAMKVAKKVKGLVKHLFLVASAPPAGIFLRGQVNLRMLRPRYTKAWTMKEPWRPTDNDMRALALNCYGNPTDFIEYDMVDESGQALKEIIFHRHSVDAGGISCGVSVLAGAQDKLITPGVQRQIARKFNTTPIFFEGADHMMIVGSSWHNVCSHIMVEASKIS